jgi:hypothetical protein
VLTAVAVGTNGLDDDQLEALLVEVDLDGDGLIDLAEFTTWLESSDDAATGRLAFVEKAKAYLHEAVNTKDAEGSFKATLEASKDLKKRMSLKHLKVFKGVKTEEWKRLKADLAQINKDILNLEQSAFDKVYELEEAGDFPEGGTPFQVAAGEEFVATIQELVSWLDGVEFKQFTPAPEEAVAGDFEFQTEC